VIITTPSLIGLSISGSGDATLHGLSGKSLAVSISGSGDVRADGQVDSVSLDIDGSGDADLSALEARSASVLINGSGDANVYASSTLQAVINGSGDIRYHGNPGQISKRVNGSGEIAQR
jgi:hypothetical protein